MSSYKFCKSFCTSEKGSFNFASLCILQQAILCDGYRYLFLCLTDTEKIQKKI